MNKVRDWHNAHEHVGPPHEVNVAAVGNRVGQSTVLTCERESDGHMLSVILDADTMASVVHVADDLGIGWIPVTERLPDEDGAFLVCGSTIGSTQIGWWEAALWWGVKGSSVGVVTHWRPLPGRPV